MVLHSTLFLWNYSVTIAPCLDFLVKALEAADITLGDNNDIAKTGKEYPCQENRLTSYMNELGHCLKGSTISPRAAKAPGLVQLSLLWGADMVHGYSSYILSYKHGWC